MGEPGTPDERGSLCNRFMILDSNNASITQSLDAASIRPPLQKSEKVEKSLEGKIEKPEKFKKPPKIWISKSASMDDDLE